VHIICQRRKNISKVACYNKMKIAKINKISSGLKTCIWPLNLKAINNKIRPSEVYIATNLNDGWNEEDHTIEDEAKNNPQWGEGFATIELMHIIETNQHSTSEDLPNYMPKTNHHYYVDMIQNFTMIKQQLT
jgi:hypothetical protein